jgi:hypothetical protein
VVYAYRRGTCDWPGRGCNFRRTQNQLVFVEYNGKLSRLNLFRTGTVVSTGTTVLKGTWTLDLDTGVEGGPGPNFDIWGASLLPGSTLRRRRCWFRSAIPPTRSVLISLTAATAQVIASGVDTRPSSAAVVSTAELLICTDQTI